MADTGYKVTGTVETAGTWTNFTTAVINTSDNNWATSVAFAAYSVGEVSDFSFGIPGGATPDGIEAQAEFSSNGAIKTAYIRLSLSWDDGSSWTSTKEDTVTGTTDITRTYGGASDNWGKSDWTDSHFANGTFRVKIEGKVDGLSGSACRLDFFHIKVYYTEVTTDIDSHHGVSWGSVSEVHGVAEASISQLHGVDNIAGMIDSCQWERDGYIWKKAA